METEPTKDRRTTKKPAASVATEKEVPVPGATLSEQEALEIATDAYIYAFPLVLMAVTRRVMCNCEVPDKRRGNRAPVNQFAHMQSFPDATFTDVVRANADTLYSAMFFDVSTEPLIISVPDSNGRYYLLPMLDMWTDIFASPGKRTTGTQAQTLAITGPGWSGTLPTGVEEIRAPTGTGWIIGRTQTNGKADYDAVHAFQARLTSAPLSAWGKKYVAPRGKADKSIDMGAPGEQVQKMDAATFWALVAEASAANPPHANDYPMLQRLKRLGLVLGQLPNLQKNPSLMRTLEQGMVDGQKRIIAAATHLGATVNGWDLILSPIGTYATDYLRRAAVAVVGLGANVLEDALYPSAIKDVDGKPLDSASKYVIHLDKSQIPPVRAFWSVTMYDERQFFAANPTDRYAIGDRDDLIVNKDGSIDLYLQRQSPGKEKERNWLPTPEKGAFSLTMRLYWPKPAAFDGSWGPPPLKRVG